MPSDGQPSQALAHGLSCGLLAQSALVLDLLKSYQYLRTNHKIDHVLLCGHSMGGASAMIAAAWLTVST